MAIKILNKLFLKLIIILGFFLLFSSLTSNYTYASNYGNVSKTCPQGSSVPPGTACGAAFCDNTGINYTSYGISGGNCTYHSWNCSGSSCGAQYSDHYWSESCDKTDAERNATGAGPTSPRRCVPPTLSGLSTSTFCQGPSGTNRASGVTFTWNSLPGITSYNVSYSNGSASFGPYSTSTNSITIPNSSCTTGPGGCSFSYSIPLSWSVEACGGDSGNSCSSASGPAFTTQDCSGTVQPPPPGGSCGDGICGNSSGESCSTCSSDCGTCAPPPPPPALNTATIIVYGDTNGNGIQDSGELGASGIGIDTCSGNTSPCNSSSAGYNGRWTTDINGQLIWQASASNPVTETFSIVLPSGYNLTTTNPVAISLPPDQTINFGINSGTNPYCTSLTANPSTASQVGDTSTLTATCANPSGNTLTYNWSAATGTVFPFSSVNNTTWTATGATLNNTSETVAVQVCDDVTEACSASVQAQIAIVPPAPPPVATYSISGNVFVDTNADTSKNNGETNYTNQIAITSTDQNTGQPSGTITYPVGDATKNYQVAGLLAGTYTISYTNLPTGYSLTIPVNGPPPQHSVTVPCSSENVYVLDPFSNNNRIQIFDGDGNFVNKWGDYGAGNGQIHQPLGIALDSLGNVYVADRGNYRVEKFDGIGNYIGQWGSQGDIPDGQFDLPSAIAIDSSDNVYVADTDNDRVQKFDSDGNFITKWGTVGTGDGQFVSPAGITIDSSGNVLVVDTDNHRVEKFDSNGNFISKFGSQGSGDGQMEHPTSIDVDSSGNIYILDAFNDRVEKFDSDGNYITKWGSQGSGDGQFNNPDTGLAVDSSDNIFVSDYYNYRIQKFDSNGNFISKFGSQGSADGQFGGPEGIAITAAFPTSEFNFTCLNEPTNTGSIDDLNFGITNALPWIQSIGGDITGHNISYSSGGGLINNVPSNVSIAIPIPGGLNPGIINIGSGSLTFDPGKISATNWVVGGTGPDAYVYNVPSSGIKTSYNYINSLLTQSGITPTSICANSLTTCNLSNQNLTHGVYKIDSGSSDGEVEITGNAETYTFPPGNFVILVNGDLDIETKILVPNGSTVFFTVSGDLTIYNPVGEDNHATSCIPPTTLGAVSTGCDLEGYYSTDKNFIVDGFSCTENPNQKRLNVAGAIVANASLNSASATYINNRNLCGDNVNYPAFSITERPDFILNSPDLLKTSKKTWQEIAP